VPWQRLEPGCNHLHLAAFLHHSERLQHGRERQVTSHQAPPLPRQVEGGGS
jgi:hypothetical protein